MTKPEVDLDALTRELTAFDSFRDLVWDRRRPGSAYRPTLRADLDPRYALLADAYDAERKKFHSNRRCFRG